MYKFSKENILEKLNNKKKSYSLLKQELKEVEDKLKSIETYNDLLGAPLCNFIFAILIAFGSLLLLSEFVAVTIISPTIEGTLLGLVVDALFLSCSIVLPIKFIRKGISFRKEIKAFKKNGIKKLKREKNNLLDRQNKLKIECGKMLTEINTLSEFLGHIDFFEQTSESPFFQADTKEEYKLLSNDKINNNSLLDEELKNLVKSFDLKDQYEKLLDEFSKEKIDYSKVHLTNDYVKKLEKNMILRNELYRNEERRYEFDDTKLNNEYGLNDEELNGTPNPIAIENFAAVNYLNSLLSNYISSFHYTKQGYVASYYNNGKFNNTFVISEDIRNIRIYFINTLKGLLSNELIDILSDESISLFEAAMRINYHISNNQNHLKNINKQKDRFDSINQNNCDNNHLLMQRVGVRDIDDLLNNHIGPTYLKYRGYTRSFDNLDNEGNILLQQNANILSDEETYQEYLDYCGNDHTTRVVLNAMSTDCSADMVAWGYKIISGVSPENIKYEDINQAYLDYQNYFLPGSNQVKLTKK